MHHLHFEKLSSTQIFLKSKLDELKVIDEDILVSCTEQTEGIGRQGNTWQSFPNSIALSFTLKPNPTPTLTPIEIGVMTLRFIKAKYKRNLFLKWPNDILNFEGKKCGGILCQYLDSNTVLSGLGLNLGRLESFNHEFRHGLASVDNEILLSDHDVQILSEEMYVYFLNNRILDVDELKKEFTRYCFHMNREVYIFENDKDYLGIFRGIGKNGEALVEIDSHLHTFLSSSLTMM